MIALQSRSWQPKELDAGCLQPEISSFRLHLAAEGKAARTVRTYTEAVQWFAAACLAREAGRRPVWEDVRRQDVQGWIAWLLGRHSAAYASSQFRALQQFFKWLAAEEEIPDPMAGLRPPHVPDTGLRDNGTAISGENDLAGSEWSRCPGVYGLDSCRWSSCPMSRLVRMAGSPASCRRLRSSASSTSMTPIGT